MDFNNFYIYGNGNEYLLQVSYLLNYFTCDVNMTSLSHSCFMLRMSCDSVCCMCCEAWSSRWLMMQLTNGQHACVLVFRPVVDILNIPVNLFSLYLIDFMLHTTVDAVGNILRVHYKSMKCDVSFSQDSVSTLFRWGERVIHVCVRMFFLHTAVQKLQKSNKFSRVIITNVLPRFLWITV